MAKIATATVQSQWECKWSRPGFRLDGIDEAQQPESVWVCVRTGERRKLSEHTCDNCPYWQQDEFRKN
jgi:hypothetical protein